MNLKKTSQNRILDKIKKCLKLSASSNANEAATALRQAQAMMAEYNITLTDVAAAEASSSSAKSSVKAKPSDWEAHLAITVAEAFSYKIIFQTGGWTGQRGSWLFIGVDASPELASYAFQVLHHQLKKGRTDYVKNQLKRCKPATKTTRGNSYCRSWVLSASDKITAIAPSEAAASAITAYIDKNHNNLSSLLPRTGKNHGRGDLAYKDFEAGHLGGKSATLNRGMNGDADKAAIEHQPY